WARDIVGAASSGEASQVNGEMVDRPVIERARQVLRRAALV
ncbi:CoA ester lyase, partial [Mesorhizobium sp. M7A.T.Ca.TU.009.01.3.1]